MSTADTKAIIKINVGGTELLTYKETLLSYPNSILAQKISNPVKGDFLPNDPNTYFIDYSAERFLSVLDFLRTGQWPLFSSASSAQNFKTDMHHFGLLPFLYEKVNEPSKKMSPLCNKKKRAFKKFKKEDESQL